MISRGPRAATAPLTARSTSAALLVSPWKALALPPAFTIRCTVSSAEETVLLIVKAGGKAKAFQGDTSKAADVDRAVSGAVAALGPLEIMVNNAGILDGYFNVDEMV